MNRAFRIVKLLTLLIAILLCLAVPVSALISTATSWHGVCHGFTDGQVDCPWWKYTGYEMFWASFGFAPFLFVAAIVWLGMALAEFIQARLRKRRQKRQS
jgi:hypothetical protein